MFGYELFFVDVRKRAKVFKVRVKLNYVRLFYIPATFTSLYAGRKRHRSNYGEKWSYVRLLFVFGLSLKQKP